LSAHSAFGTAASTAAGAVAAPGSAGVVEKTADAAKAANDIFTTFTPFTLFHLITAGTLTLAIILAIVLGRRWRGTPREKRLRLTLGYTTIVFQAWGLIYYALPANLNPAESLPLHICDVAGWLAPIAILTQYRWFRIMLYYWGIGLSTQAFFTPVVDEGYGYWKFWLFWIGHTQIIGLAFYDVCVLGFRPTWKSLWVATISTLIYVIGMLLPFNILTGFNYGYVGNKLPEKKTILNELGPWPGRVFIMAGIVFTIFFLATIVWPAAAAIRKALGRENAVAP
jgi:hypothetical integral membrane protein (TIGR02206 family)